MADVLGLLREFGREIGLAGLLVLILVAGYRKWWVWGWRYQEMQRERDEWRRIALRGREKRGETGDLDHRAGE